MTFLVLYGNALCIVCAGVTIQPLGETLGCRDSAANGGFAFANMGHLHWLWESLLDGAPDE